MGAYFSYLLPQVGIFCFCFCTLLALLQACAYKRLCFFTVLTLEWEGLLPATEYRSGLLSGLHWVSSLPCSWPLETSISAPRWLLWQHCGASLGTPQWNPRGSSQGTPLAFVHVGDGRLPWCIFGSIWLESRRYCPSMLCWSMLPQSFADKPGFEWGARCQHLALFPGLFPLQLSTCTCELKRKARGFNTDWGFDSQCFRPFSLLCALHISKTVVLYRSTVS